ncbi:MAG: serine/threonine protein kinase, partial [Myxococcota bacterium]|nr:serine/threonine protein kinase [Myxococcota bacterium]
MPREGPPVSIHTVRLGSYKPLLELASGGMATVYVAKQVGAAGFERLVVIKRVHPHLLSNRDFYDMFRDEARVCSTIRHPNVVPVVDVAEVDGELFLVLEYVESLALSALLRAAAGRGERLEPAVVVRIFADALAGLHAAHEAVDMRGNRIELIHRDVSPQNVIVGLDGTSRLIDFGIAKAASRISVTHSGVVKGKLRYMSPEQLHQKRLDRRADIFAAGVVLYEALTGQRPFGGEDDGDVVLGILIGEAPSASSVVPRLPSALDAVVARALDRDRDRRFQTAAEFQEALERAVAPASARAVARTVERLGGEGFELRRAALQASLVDDAMSSPREPPAIDGPGPLAMATSTTRGVLAESPVHRRAGWVVVVGALVIVVAAATLLGARRSAPGRAEASATPSTPPSSVVVGADPTPSPGASAIGAPEPLTPT